jgi:hypothetical protein
VHAYAGKWLRGVLSFFGKVPEMHGGKALNICKSIVEKIKKNDRGEENCFTNFFSPASLGVQG